MYPLHVLGPLPEALLGAVSEQTRDAQAVWMADARASTKPLLEKARFTLERCGLAADTVEPRTAEAAKADDVAKMIVQAARSLDCCTVVVGRDSISWAPQLFYRHIAETVAREAGHMAVWIVGRALGLAVGGNRPVVGL